MFASLRDLVGPNGHAFVQFEEHGVEQINGTVLLNNTLVVLSGSMCFGFSWEVRDSTSFWFILVHSIRGMGGKSGVASIQDSRRPCIIHRDEAAAVRREHCPASLVKSLPTAHFAASRQTPEPDRAVIAATGYGFSVRIEHNIQDPSSMPFESQQFLARWDVPHFDGCVYACRGHQSTVC